MKFYVETKTKNKHNAITAIQQTNIYKGKFSSGLYQQTIKHTHTHIYKAHAYKQTFSR